jgi:hypothetical protein
MYRDELFDYLATDVKSWTSRRICIKLHFVRVSESSHCNHKQAACTLGLPDLIDYLYFSDSFVQHLRLRMKRENTELQTPWMRGINAEALNLHFLIINHRTAIRISPSSYSGFHQCLNHKLRSCGCIN